MKFSIQIGLVVCIIAELVLMLKIINSIDVLYNKLYTGLAIVVLLAMIRLINILTNTIYGNHEKN
jgi:hypothetical protein